MFNIGVTEILLILGVALLVLGPNKLPEVARMVGRGLREFRRTARELEEELDPIRETLQPEYYGDLGLDEQDMADAEAHQGELDAEQGGDPPEEGDPLEDSLDTTGGSTGDETVSIRPPEGATQPFRGDETDEPPVSDEIGEWDVPEEWDEIYTAKAAAIPAGPPENAPKEEGGETATPPATNQPTETQKQSAQKQTSDDRKKPVANSSDERGPTSKTT